MAFSIPKIREEYCHYIGYPTGPPSYLGAYIVTNCSAASRPRGEGMGGGGGGGGGEKGGGGKQKKFLSKNKGGRALRPLPSIRH